MTETKDKWIQIIIIILATVITISITSISNNQSAIRNAIGLTFQLVGFTAMLVGRWNPKNKYPRAQETGIALVISGLLLQISSIFCTEFGFRSLCEA